MNGVYYNENDPKAAAWLSELILAGELPEGYIDTRSIEDVRPSDLIGYTQCHFFAGIGGWPYALRLAGWSDDWPVWTGSCPCQPYSAAGTGGGDNDPRALWWAWRWLIDQCRPPVVLGEQVASKAGRLWLAGVRADLETLGYAVGAADLCAAGVGAPHIRQRLWWLAHTTRQQSYGGGCERPERRGEYSDGSSDGGLGDAYCKGLEERERHSKVQRQAGRARKREASELPGNPWSNAIWIPCADGKARRIEPGLEPLANGVSDRVALLRGFGNAIVPQVAAEFIAAYMEVKG